MSDSRCSHTATPGQHLHLIPAIRHLTPSHTLSHLLTLFLHSHIHTLHTLHTLHTHFFVYSVASLLNMPSSKGLFARAILESNPVGCVY